jgi:hypothetical protein
MDQARDEREPHLTGAMEPTTDERYAWIGLTRALVHPRGCPSMSWLASPFRSLFMNAIRGSRGGSSCSR